MAQRAARRAGLDGCSGSSGLEPYRAHSQQAAYIGGCTGAPCYLGPIGASLPVQLILWHLRLRPALPLPRPAVKCIKSNRVRPTEVLVCISIPRRNCSALEKGQLQVRRDLCQAVALEHKCRGWPSVGPARAVVRSGFQAQSRRV